MSEPKDPLEFRREAVALVREKRRTIREVSESLGVPEQRLQSWVKQAQLETDERDRLSIEKRIRQQVADWLAARPGVVAELRSQWLSPVGAVSVIGALGVVGYVWFRLASDIFYGKLGASPEELGVRYPTVLAQAVYGVGVGILLAAFFIAVICLPAWIAFKMWTKLTLLRVLAGIVALGAVAAVTRLSFGWNVLSWKTIVLWVLLIMVLGIGVMLGRELDRISTWARALLFVGLPIVVAAWAPVSEAWRDANAVYRGDAPPVRVYAALSPWDAKVAVLHWKSAAPKGIDFGCVFYLGQSSAGAIIYATGDDGVRRLIRVPARDALIEVRPDSSSCSGWAKGPSPKRRR